VTGISRRLLEMVACRLPAAALTGAGISAESGVATFRGPDGHWEQISLEDLATPEGFARDPKKVWTWYDRRRQQLATCAPNAGHLALARYEAVNPRFTLITQNVDGLHAAAGSRRVVTLHGEIFRVRCTRDGGSREDRRVPLPEIPPRCDCGALLRPDVVWFGEPLSVDALRAATTAAEDAELFLSVGTSSLVYPAAGLPEIARRRGAYLVEINVEPTPLAAIADEVIRGPAARVLPELFGAEG